MKISKYLTEEDRPKIIIALGKNWHGVYVRNKLRWQGYLENIDKFIEALEDSGFLQEDAVDFKSVDSKWLFKKTKMPDDLNDIKWETSSQEYRKTRIIDKKKDTRKSITLGNKKDYSKKIKYPED